MRSQERSEHDLRNVSITTGVNRYSDGSCLIKYGHTHVMCTAVIEENVPPFLRNTKTGWVTAEYGMLPSATHQRMVRSKILSSGRTLEIQRLIGRSLRMVVDMKLLGERQIRIDCDVLQADGGTRTASITGGYVALRMALLKLMDDQVISVDPGKGAVSAVSCGIFEGKHLVDLDYDEDSSADVDANFVMMSDGNLVEVQGTGEGCSFSSSDFMTLMSLAERSCQQLSQLQERVLEEWTRSKNTFEMSLKS